MISSKVFVISTNLIHIVTVKRKMDVILRYQYHSVPKYQKNVCSTFLQEHFKNIIINLLLYIDKYIILINIIKLSNKLLYLECY